MSHEECTIPDQQIKALVGSLVRRVIEWEIDNWVPYPWRINRTPYRVLIAEFLLKRTTRQAVAREYPRFIARFPDIHSIHRADEKDLEDALKSLGLYRQRAVQLKELAETIIERHGGEIPDEFSELTSLPGVGPYIAGAVLSFGFGKKAPVVDSNVARLLSRLTGLRFKSTEGYLRLAWILVPEKDHELFNYGLVDLGAVVCHYRDPRCLSCVLRDLCVHVEGQSRAGRADLSGLYAELERLAQNYRLPYNKAQKPTKPPKSP